jgi:hypothetical protein
VRPEDKIQPATEPPEPIDVVLGRFDGPEYLRTSTSVPGYVSYAHWGLVQRPPSGVRPELVEDTRGRWWVVFEYQPGMYRARPVVPPLTTIDDAIDAIEARKEEP